MELSFDIKKSRIADLLCCAFEGGSNYWYTIDFDKSTRPSKICFDAFEEGDLLNKEVFRHLHWPISEGGRLCILDREGEDKNEYFLDLPAIDKGLEILATKYPKHFADFMNENDDADTGDVFLQCCLFGEAIYG